MSQIVEKTWEYLETAIGNLQEDWKGLELEKNAKNLYAKEFENLYEYIKKQYMSQEVEYLDRHKVAAIIMIAIIRSDAIVYKGQIPENQVFLGTYFIAASTGFSYMKEKVDALLKTHGYHIDKIWFPTPISCETPFFEVFSRNLYFAATDSEWGLNPLAIAEELFILEYVTLEKAGIDPQILKGTTCY